jgi:hypothetical protein
VVGLAIIEETPKGEEILAISEGDDFYNIIDWDYFEENWMFPRIRKGVYVRMLTRFDNVLYKTLQKNDKEHLRQMRVLPKSFKSLGSIWISNNKIINWNTVMARAIVIEDRVMADFYREMFEVLWGSVG